MTESNQKQDNREAMGVLIWRKEGHKSRYKRIIGRDTWAHKH